MKSVGIVGVGLIGGSFGLALRKAGFSGEIVGVSSPQTISQAVELGAIDRGVTLQQAAACDLVYLAQPILAIEQTLTRLGPLIAPETLVTDAGSTKKSIVSAAKQYLPSKNFLGGHPMAGKEQRGVTVASGDLFQGRPYIVTPEEPENFRTPAISEFLSWVECCGAYVMVVTPEAHDRSVAFTSHLPQMVSTALAASLHDSLEPVDALRLSGPGLADMSRLALSSYDIWQDILATNSSNIEHALNVYIDKLTELRDNLQSQRVGTVFANAAAIAQRIRRLNTGQT